MKTLSPITEAQELKLALEVIKMLDGLSASDAKGVLLKAESLVMTSAKIEFMNSALATEWHSALAGMLAYGTSAPVQPQGCNDSTKTSPLPAFPAQSSERKSGPGSFESL